MSVAMREAPRGTTELVPRFVASCDEYVCAAEVSPDGHTVALGLGDGRVLLVDARDGRTVQDVVSHPGGVLAMSFAPDGSELLTGGQDGTARRLVGARSHPLELPAGGRGWVERVAYAPSGDRFAVSRGRSVYVFDRDGRVERAFDVFASTVTGVAFRPDGHALLVACYGGVHVLPLGAVGRARHVTWKGSPISLAQSPDGKVVACGNQDGTVRFFRFASGRDAEMSGYPYKPRALAWDHESRLLATAGDAAVTVWDFRGKGPEGSRPLQLESHRGLVTELAFDRHVGRLASGSEDTSVLLWHPRRGPKPTGYAFLDDVVTALSFHPDGRCLFAADASGVYGVFESPGTHGA